MHRHTHVHTDTDTDTDTDTSTGADLHTQWDTPPLPLFTLRGDLCKAVRNRIWIYLCVYMCITYVYIYVYMHTHTYRGHFPIKRARIYIYTISFCKVPTFYWKRPLYTCPCILKGFLQNEQCDLETGSQWYMGWLRLVGSLKLQVSFAKEPHTRDNILQKRPIIWRSLLIVATP